MILKIETLYYISVKLLITLVFLMFKIKYAMHRKLSEICISGLNFQKIVLKGSRAAPSTGAGMPKR